MMLPRNHHWILGPLNEYKAFNCAAERSERPSMIRDNPSVLLKKGAFEDTTANVAVQGS